MYSREGDTFMLAKQLQLYSQYELRSKKSSYLVLQVQFTVYKQHIWLDSPYTEQGLSTTKDISITWRQPVIISPDSH